jgi:hypothetical protein
MTVSMTRHYRLRVFPPGELRRILRDVLSYGSRVDVSRALSDGSRRHQKDVSDDDLRLVCDVARDHVEAFGEVYLTLEGRDDVAMVRVAADTSRRAREVFERLERALHLEEVIPPPLPPESSPPDRRRRVRCFLSYRADEDTTRVALTVQRFLGLLDVEVIAASAREPGAIGESVLEKLERDRDFITVVVSSSGEPPWTSEDLGRARARGALVIPVVECGSPFVPGPFGDVDCIGFVPGHVGDAFLRLLEAVRFVAAHATLG